MSSSAASPFTAQDAASPLTERVAALMPGLIDELSTLVAIPSVAFPGFPAEPVHRMGEAVVDLLQRSGAPDARLLPIPGGYPAVWAEIPAPAGAPTVLLYAHYDVQPAPVEQGWDTDPFVATTGADGRIYGRGAADDKSGLIIHAGTLQAFAGEIPVGVKILIEGEEETISHLEDFVDANPAMFDCDAFVIADMGNQSVGRPALTTALRGEVSCTVRVRTLAFPVHSGVAGGAAPDALVALIRILATLHDDDGNTIVPGVSTGEWPGADVDEQVYRESSGVLARCRADRLRDPGLAALGQAIRDRHRDRCADRAGRVQRADSRSDSEGVDADRARRGRRSRTRNCWSTHLDLGRPLARRGGGHPAQGRVAVRRRHVRARRARRGGRG